MLEVKDATLRVGGEEEVPPLLKKISLRIPRGQFVAVVGPSGCGKSTLLKMIAGLSEPDEGGIFWEGRDLAEEDLAPAEIGYVPQFSIAYEFLTVQESVETTLRLRVGGLGTEERCQRVEEILRQAGLEEISDRQVRVLSGGQKRRLALAMEMASSPLLLLCDEVTSGLDPKAEEEMVKLMRRMAGDGGRIVLSVTHSLRHLSLYDRVIVLYQGCVAYHGPGKFLLHHFGATHPEEIYPKLATREAEEWRLSWEKRREAYDSSRQLHRREAAKEAGGGQKEEMETSEPEDLENSKEDSSLDREMPLPSALAQFLVLTGRRWKIFFRARTQMWLQVALMLGFPCLVVIFALHGLPQIQNLNMQMDSNVIEQLKETADFVRQSSKVGGLVSGLVMFQVVLLTLMASNNSAREVAGERLIFEKEKLAGLRPASYLASKAFFLFFLVAAQSIWMGVFVSFICHFPGDLLSQMVLLFLVDAGMTTVCLGISSAMSSPEQASLVSIYLVGFQLPLSGAVLALPAFLGHLTRPFIAAYWSWSGILQTMRDTRFYDVVQVVTQTELSRTGLCLWMLISHVIFGLAIAYIGCRNSRWE